MTNSDPAAGLRVELPVAGREIAVVGGGVAALGRIAALRAARAEVVVYAVDAVASVVDFAARDLIRLHHRDATAADLASAWLVYAATGDVDRDAEVAAEAEAAGRGCLGGAGPA